MSSFIPSVLSSPTAPSFVDAADATPKSSSASIRSQRSSRLTRRLSLITAAFVYPAPTEPVPAIPSQYADSASGSSSGHGSSEGTATPIYNPARRNSLGAMLRRALPLRDSSGAPPLPPSKQLSSGKDDAASIWSFQCAGEERGATFGTTPGWACFDPSAAPALDADAPLRRASSPALFAASATATTPSRPKRLRPKGSTLTRRSQFVTALDELPDAETDLPTPAGWNREVDRRIAAVAASSLPAAVAIARSASVGDMKHSDSGRSTTHTHQRSASSLALSSSTSVDAASSARCDMGASFASQRPSTASGRLHSSKPRVPMSIDTVAASKLNPRSDWTLGLSLSANKAGPGGGKRRASTPPQQPPPTAPLPATPLSANAATTPALPTRSALRAVRSDPSLVQKKAMQAMSLPSTPPLVVQNKQTWSPALLSPLRAAAEKATAAECAANASSGSGSTTPTSTATSPVPQAVAAAASDVAPTPPAISPRSSSIRTDRYAARALDLDALLHAHDSEDDFEEQGPYDLSRSTPRAHAQPTSQRLRRRQLRAVAAAQQSQEKGVEVGEAEEVEMPEMIPDNSSCSSTPSSPRSTPSPRSSTSSARFEPHHRDLTATTAAPKILVRKSAAATAGAGVRGAKKGGRHVTFLKEVTEVVLEVQPEEEEREEDWVDDEEELVV